MNASNINASNAGDPLGKNRGLSIRRETETASGITSGRDTAKVSPDTETTERETVRAASDTFQTTRDRDFVASLVDAVESEEAPVREDAVARARSRVNEGYYNTPEFMQTLASRLINTERA